MSPLSSCRSGQTVVIQSLSGGRVFRQRLIDMGFCPGEMLEVINTGGGPVIVRIKGSRIGIGRGMARGIMVKEGL
ncbi:MAG: FeoA family protein [Thermodesulfobacteriota bacterium]|nr:FeoA family protein [Thermodesulfobacteriota bacterium]